MEWFGEIGGYTVWVPTLMLVIFRVAGVFLTAPMLNSPVIPMQVKAMMSLVVGLAITGRMVQPTPMPDHWAALVLGIGSEMLIGGTIGYVANLLFMGVQIGAGQIGQQMGVALANVFNPLAEETTNVMSSMFHLTALVLFLTMGGHRTLIAGLLETFDRAPLMSFGAGPAVLEMVVRVLTAALVLALKLAAPVLLAMLLASMSLGLIQRTMPQLNILSAGFQIRVMLALVILAGSVAALPPLLRIGWEVILRELARVL